MSLDAAYKADDDFFDAVNAAPKIDIHMPKTDKEWDIINQDFKTKSTNEIITYWMVSFSVPTNQAKRKHSMCQHIIPDTTNPMECARYVLTAS